MFANENDHGGNLINKIVLQTVVVVGAVLVIPQAIQAAEIASSLAYACEDATIFGRIASAAKDGDRVGAEAIFKRAVSSKSCRPIPAGTQVRVEKRATGYYCVTPFGSDEPCRWVQAQEVRP